MIGHSTSHLTVLVSQGWLVLILVSLATVVFWQVHANQVILVSERRIHSEVFLRQTKLVNLSLCHD